MSPWVKRGGSQKVSDWLVIPLAIELHSLGSDGIDSGCGVLTWEKRFGTQFDHLVWVCRQLGVDVFDKANIASPFTTGLEVIT